MKIVGRKTSAAYELYGFIPKVENGKHSAICKSCNRVLQNTAAVRLQKHRNSCGAGRITTSGDPVQFSNIEILKGQITSTAETDQQNESVNANVKKEHCNTGFEDSNINDETNDNSTYEETTEINLKDYNNISPHKSTAKKDRTDDNLEAKIQYFKAKSKYFRSEMNNLKFEKTMMVLKVKKLRLEIQQLEVVN